MEIMKNMLLGVHCSVGGGLQNAFDEADLLGIDVFQIFTRNQRQWNSKIISEEEKKIFSAAWKKSKVKTVFSHCSYLLNLASDDPELRKKSTVALKVEVERCHELGLAWCVLHPGAAKGQNENTALGNVIRGLMQVLKETAHSQVKILLENTAGQGTSIGHSFEQLKYIINGVGSPRIGVCFDTCHAFAAGYDMRTKSAFEKTVTEFDAIIGMKNLFAVHLNDSRGKLGSSIDRHEHIGKGELGMEAFRLAMSYFAAVPKVIETNKEDDMDQKNLRLLRSFAV